MTLDKELLIRRVAENHKFVLTDDDPIIATTAIHDVIFEMYAEMLLKKLEAQHALLIKGFQAALARSREDTIREFEKLVNLNASKEERIMQGHKELTEKVFSSVSQSLAEAHQSQNLAWWIMIGTIFFGLLSALANLYILNQK